MSVKDLNVELTKITSAATLATVAMEKLKQISSETARDVEKDLSGVSDRINSTTSEMTGLGGGSSAEKFAEAIITRTGQ